MLKATNATNAGDGDITQEIVSESKGNCISEEEKIRKMDNQVEEHR